MRAIACTLVLASTLVLAAGQMHTVFEWSTVDYVWPNESMKYEYMATGEYSPSVVLPMDVDRDKAGRVFVSFLGARGTPATLGVVTNAKGRGGPLIQPYPNWSWFTPVDSCHSLKNVYRVAIDECNRLWALDIGRREGEPSSCTPQLVVFDLNTDRHLRTINIPNNIAIGANVAQSLLATPVVDTEGPHCEKTTVYIAEIDGSGLIIVDDKHIRRLDYPIFQGDPNANIMTSGGVSTNFGGGILGLSISPRIFQNEKKYLYFRALGSYSIAAASIESLEKSLYGQPIDFQKKDNVLSSHAIAMAFSSRGTLFFGLTTENAIGCWNRYRPLSREQVGIVAKDFQRLQYLNGVKVIKPSPAHPEEELWVVSNRFIHYVSGKLSRHGINFRILKGSVQSIVGNTMCDLPNEYKAALQQQRN